MNNSTTKRDTIKLVMTFHSESTAHSNDINILHCEKILKIGPNSLIIDLALCQNFAISQCAQRLFGDFHEGIIQQSNMIQHN